MLSSRRVVPALLAGLVAFLCAAVPAAAADRPFAQRFAVTDTGDLAMTGNTVLTCPTAASGCTAARAGTSTGTQATNNGFAMERVDVDFDASTSTSSSATVSLPAGATVLWAGLYWGGKSTAADATRRAVKLRAPGTSAYTDLTAETFDALTGDSSIYQGFANVTTAVRAAGTGSYMVGNVSVGTGTALYGGWGLVVAYRAIGEQRHTILVYDGLKHLNTTDAQTATVTLTGLMTPSSGPVSADLGLLAYDGDRGLVGDRLKLAGTNVGDTLNPVDNVMNSTVSRRGTSVTTRSPSHVDQLGFGADLIEVDGALPAGATTTNLEFTAGTETYMPGVLSFVIDAETVAPQTTIASGPTGTTSTRTPVFTLTADELGSIFECRIDNGAFAPCSPAHTTAALADGAHTFEARAIDLAGNIDPTPAVRSFTVDATAPQTTMGSGPSGPVSTTVLSFPVSSDEPGSRFECRLDGLAWTACGSPATTPALADGSHTLEVRAIDAAGNTDATPASRTVVIDTRAPQTAIASGPGATTEDATPSFVLSADDPTARFECRMDGGAWAPCAAAYTSASLADGPHTLDVRAIDLAGNADPTPESRSFTVARPVAPVTEPAANDPQPRTVTTDAQSDATQAVTGAGGSSSAATRPSTGAAVNGTGTSSTARTGPGCAGTSGFRSATLRGSGRALGIRFARRVSAPVRADIFQVSAGRTVLQERLIARYRGMTRSRSWPGAIDAHGRRIADGYYFVRLSIPLGAGRGVDTRRLVARRTGGRWSVQPGFYGRPICGLVTSYKLERPVFGGAATGPERVTFRLARSAKVTVEVFRGRNLVKRLGGKTYAARRTVRLSLGAARLTRGSYRFRLTAVSGGRRAVATATARRL